MSKVSTFGLCLKDYNLKWDQYEKLTLTALTQSHQICSVATSWLACDTDCDIGNVIGFPSVLDDLVQFYRTYRKA